MKDVLRKFYTENDIVHKKLGHCIGCVYAITNTNNGKVYIGGTLMPKTRIKNHFKLLSKGKHYSKSFQQDYDNFGEDCFAVTLVYKYFFGSNHGISWNQAHAEITYVEKNTIYHTQPDYNTQFKDERGLSISDEHEMWVIKRQRRTA